MSYTYEGQAVLAVRCRRDDDGKTVTYVPQVVLDDGSTGNRRTLWEGEGVSDALDAVRVAGDRLEGALRALLRSNLVDVGSLGEPPRFIEGRPL